MKTETEKYYSHSGFDLGKNFLPHFLIGMVLGMGIALLIGLYMNNIGAGIAVGPAFGTGLGFGLHGILNKSQRNSEQLVSPKQKVMLIVALSFGLILLIASFFYLFIN